MSAVPYAPAQCEPSCPYPDGHELSRNIVHLNAGKVGLSGVEGPHRCKLLRYFLASIHSGGQTSLEACKSLVTTNALRVSCANILRHDVLP